MIKKPFIGFCINWHAFFYLAFHISKGNHVIHLNQYAFRVDWDYPGQTGLYSHLKFAILY